MRSLVKASSIRMARMASLNLREKESSPESRKFFATCWVMVDAPTGLRSPPRLTRFVTTAFATLSGSMPKCS